jgi:hypothetical protein
MKSISVIALTKNEKIKIVGVQKSPRVQTLEYSSAEDGVLFASFCTIKTGIALIKPSNGVQVEGQC